MDGPERTQLVKRLAAELGFERCGVAAAGPIRRGDYLREWLAAGRAGTMGYLHRRIQSRLDPRELLRGARSVIVVALQYRQPEPAIPRDSPRGRVAMYAWGEDYHVVIRDKLDRLIASIRSRLPEPFEARACVDTSAIVERELAAAAGIGWIGKNTLVLHQDLGSYFFLGEVITTLDLVPDAAATDHCGSCTRCLDACPTSAFPNPYEMDARRCISYLTIEYRGEIDPALENRMGRWVFGCDVCQQVCPFNRDAPATREPAFSIRAPGPCPELDAISKWTESDYLAIVTDSATERATLDMWKRNARISLSHADQSDGLTGHTFRPPT